MKHRYKKETNTSLFGGEYFVGISPLSVCCSQSVSSFSFVCAGAVILLSSDNDATTCN